MMSLNNSTSPWQPELSLAHTLATQAEIYALKYFRQTLQIETKANGTPVTIVDKAVENLISQGITQAYPEDTILGEEHGYQASGAQASRRWLIDPIDGTSEFIAGSEHWGSNIALEADGKLVLGLITRPVLGMRWWATHGRGAFYRSSPDQPPQSIALSKTVALSQSKVTLWEQTPGPRSQRLQNRGIWVPPRLANLVELLQGKIEGFVDLIGSPWDHAALVVIVSEAGGTAQDIYGGQRIDLGEVRYTNGKIDTEFFALLNLLK